MFVVQSRRPGLAQQQPVLNPNLRSATALVGNHPFSRQRVIGRPYPADPETFLTTKGVGQTGVLSGNDKIGQGPLKTSAFSGADFRIYSQKTTLPILPNVGRGAAKQMHDEMEYRPLGRVTHYHIAKAKHPWRATIGSRQANMLARQNRSKDIVKLAILLLLRNHLHRTSSQGKSLTGQVVYGFDANVAKNAMSFDDPKTHALVGKLEGHIDRLSTTLGGQFQKSRHEYAAQTDFSQHEMGTGTEQSSLFPTSPIQPHPADTTMGGTVREDESMSLTGLSEDGPPESAKDIIAQLFYASFVESVSDSQDVTIQDIAEVTEQPAEEIRQFVTEALNTEDAKAQFENLKQRYMRFDYTPEQLLATLERKRHRSMTLGHLHQSDIVSLTFDDYLMDELRKVVTPGMTPHTSSRTQQTRRNPFEAQQIPGSSLPVPAASDQRYRF